MRIVSNPEKARGLSTVLQVLRIPPMVRGCTRSMKLYNRKWSGDRMTLEYRRLKPELLADEDKFVVIYGDELAGIWDTETFAPSLALWLQA